MFKHFLVVNWQSRVENAGFEFFLLSNMVHARQQVMPAVGREGR